MEQAETTDGSGRASSDSRTGQPVVMLLSLLIAGLVLLPRAATAQDWNGFVEALYGARVADTDFFDDGDLMVGEVRAQLRYAHYSDDAELFLRLDFTHDGLGEESSELDAREAYLIYTGLGPVDVKIGRQVLTWGVGDLVFVNDIFPKDWVSFFLGREDQYLKRPADALKASVYFELVNLDLVVQPTFTSDGLPDGQPLVFYEPALGALVGGDPLAFVEACSLVSVDTASGPREPDPLVENAVLAVRGSRLVGSFGVAGYFHRGFFTQPLAYDASGRPYYPRLHVYGASLRGSAVGGILSLEGGYYDSREDPAGDQPLIENSSLRGLVLYERQLSAELNAGLQYYHERIGDWDAYRRTLPAGMPVRDQDRSLVTVRLTRTLRYETVKLSLFAYVSPTDDDYYLRPAISYRLSDEVEVIAGGNIFGGDEEYTFFGQFDQNDNAYLRVRYGF